MTFQVRVKTASGGNLNGLKQKYRISESQFQTDQRRAVREVGGRTKGKLTTRISGSLGLPRTLVDSRIRVKSPRQTASGATATVNASGRRIDLKHYDYQVRPSTGPNAHPTRAWVSVDNSVTGGPEAALAFVNPRSRRQRTLARFFSSPKILSKAPGLTLRRPFAESVDRQLLRRTSIDLRQTVERHARQRFGGVP